MNRFHLNNKNLRRILALTLACLMIFTSLPASAFSVFAEDGEIEAVTEVLETVQDELEENGNGGGRPIP